MSLTTNIPLLRNQMTAAFHDLAFDASNSREENFFYLCVQFCKLEAPQIRQQAHFQGIRMEPQAVVNVCVVNFLEQHAVKLWPDFESRSHLKKGAFHGSRDQYSQEPEIYGRDLRRERLESPLGTRMRRYFELLMQLDDTPGGGSLPNLGTPTAGQVESLICLITGTTPQGVFGQSVKENSGSFGLLGHSTTSPPASATPLLQIPPASNTSDGFFGGAYFERHGGSFQGFGSSAYSLQSQAHDKWNTSIANIPFVPPQPSAPSRSQMGYSLFSNGSSSSGSSLFPHNSGLSSFGSSSMNVYSQPIQVNVTVNHLHVHCNCHRSSSSSFGGSSGFGSMASAFDRMSMSD